MHLGLEGFAPTVLYLGMVVSFLAGVLRRPFIPLCYLVLLLPLQTVRYKLHGMFLGGQLVDLMLLSMMIGLWRRGDQIIPKTVLNTLFVSYATFTYLSLWRGVLTIGGTLPVWFSDERLSNWKNYMILFLLLLGVTAVVTTTRQMRILVLIMCASVLLMNRAFRNEVADRDFSAFSYSLRSDGAMGYAGVNGLAAFEAQFAIFILGVAAYERRLWMKMPYLGSAIFSAYCLMLALSRGAYAAFAVGWMFIGLVRDRKLLALLAVFLCGLQAWVPPAVTQRVFTTVQEDGEIESSAGERLTVWEDAMQVFKGDPIFGTGFDTYAFMGRVGPYRDTHNLYVKILVETGVVGIALFMLILLKMLSIGWTLFRSASDPFLSSLGLGVTGWMVCVIVANIFGDRFMYLQISGYTFMVVGLAIRGLMIINSAEYHGERNEANGAVAYA